MLRRLVKISLDVDDDASLLEFVVRGEMGQELLWVDKVLGEWFQTGSFSFSENKISLKVNRPESDGTKIPE